MECKKKCYRKPLSRIFVNDKISLVILCDIRLARLMLNRPLSDQIKVLTLVMCTEIRECPECRRVHPHLSKQTRVCRAHELLTENVDTMAHMEPYNGFGIGPYTHLSLAIVVCVKPDILA